MSMIGKTLECSFRSPDYATLAIPVVDITVSDSVELDYPDMIWGDTAHDLAAYKITTSYNASSYWSANAFVGFVFDDKYDVLNDIIGVAVDTNIAGMDASRVTFTENSVSTNWSGIHFDGGSYFTVTLSFALNKVTGTKNSEALVGRADEDIIAGKAGNDVLRGMEDNDRLYGGSGNDILRGADRATIFFAPGAAMTNSGAERAPTSSSIRTRVAATRSWTSRSAWTQ